MRTLLFIVLLLLALPTKAAIVTGAVGSFDNSATLEWTYDDVSGAIQSMTITITRTGCSLTIRIFDANGVLRVDQTFTTSRTFNIPNGISRRLQGDPFLTEGRWEIYYAR